MVKAGMQGVVVNAESLFYQAKQKIARLAIARRLPTCVWVKELADDGALASYGVDQRAIGRRVAMYADSDRVQYKAGATSQSCERVSICECLR